MSALYALDTSIYITALRDSWRLGALKRFRARMGMRLRFNAVVAMELRAGAITARHEEAVDDLLAAYDRRDRVVTPSFSAYMEAGRVLCALMTRERRSPAELIKLSNDAVIAASCREADVTLVTENVADFHAIQRHLRGFRFADSSEVFG